jgi:hypothetical protein
MGHKPHPFFKTSLKMLVSWRMTANTQIPRSISSAKRRARWLRITAAVVLVLGIFGADLVYWLGTRSAEVSDDPSMLVNEKAEARQAEILYGKQAALIQNWTDELKRPGVQAVIVVSAAILIAGGCFYFARLLEHGDEKTDEV